MNDSIKQILSQIMNTHEDNAPESATYPYCVFETRLTGRDDVTSRYVLEINIWDKRDTYNRAETYSKKIDAVLDHAICNFGSGKWRTYISDKRHVQDEDKRLKRIKMEYELIAVEGE